DRREFAWPPATGNRASLAWKSHEPKPGRPLSMASCCVYADTPTRRYADTSPLRLRLRHARVTPRVGRSLTRRTSQSVAEGFALLYFLITAGLEPAYLVSSSAFSSASACTQSEVSSPGNPELLRR